ncbi:hypothetical protein P261_01022 [Lachnospiraceae bacterium TWA4]|nr:hypothetical protein P261_01022 [Lachnospiraceae bacterium TWA4]
MQDGESYKYASEVNLIADITDCESYFFLLEDPIAFQKEYQLLANADGSAPDALDFSIDNKGFYWKNTNLYLGRRCFYTDKTCNYLEEYNQLWEKLKNS